MGKWVTSAPLLRKCQQNAKREEVTLRRTSIPSRASRLVLQKHALALISQLCLVQSRGSETTLYMCLQFSTRNLSLLMDGSVLFGVTFNEKGSHTEGKGGVIACQ